MVKIEILRISRNDLERFGIDRRKRKVQMCQAGRVNLRWINFVAAPVANITSGVST